LFYRNIQRILFTEEKAKQLRVDLLNGDKYKIQLETEKNRTERLLTIQHLKDEEIELYRKQNERLLKVNDRSDTMNYIWFGLGVLETGLAVYGAAGLAR
jgi:demethoxyubiquinone hydroxylase (CLK1/Coq7/Cat5 family)